MKNIFRLLLIAAIIGISCLAIKAGPVRAAVNGSLEYVGVQRILNLWGTNYEMGYAHGYLLGDVIQSRIQWEIDQGVSTYNGYLNTTSNNFLMYPDYGNEIAGIVQGMIDSGHGNLAGVNRNVNAADMLLFQQAADRWYYCSSFAVWGTTDGKSIVGRNFDEPMSLVPLQVMLVREPSTGHKTVSWSLAGLVGIHCGINEEGITISANWGGNNQWTNGPFYLSHLINRYMLEKTTLANFSTQPLALIKGLPELSAVNWQISSPTSSYVIEDADSDTVRNATGNPHIITTNHQLSNNNGQHDDGSHDRYNTLNNSLNNLYSSGDKVVSSSEAWSLIASVAWAYGGDGTICTILLRPATLSFDVAYADGTRAAPSCTVNTFTWNQLFPNHASGPNNPPAAVGEAFTVNQNGVLATSAPGVLGNDTDADGNSLTASLVANVAHGALTLNLNGAFTYTPAAGFSGADSFTYRAFDGQDYSGDATVTIMVNPNNPPAAVNEAYSVNQNGVLAASAPGVLGNDTDTDGNSLTASLVTGVTHGSLTLNSNGAFTYTPTAGFSGADSFTYRAYDGQDYSGDATVTITVNPNNPPVAVNEAYNVNQNGVLAASAPGVLGNDTDADGNSLTAGLVANVAHGALTLNSNGAFTYIPASGFSGVDAFIYRAYDGQDYSADAVVTITVNPNNPPAAVNETYSVNRNAVLTVSNPGVLSNDTDADGNSLTAVKVSDPTHGTVTLNSNGSFVYTPTTGYSGADSFTYQAYDGSTYSNTATASITVKASNTAPVAVTDTYTAYKNTALSIASPGVLSNDTDADGNTLTAVKVGNPLRGSVTLNSNGSFVYTPRTGYTGTDSFTYRANDGTANSNTVTVRITVKNGNTVPVAANDFYSTSTDIALSIPSPGVLGNDTDADGNTLTAVKVSNPSHGSVTFNSNGSFVYTPTSGYTGSDSFTYKANDGVADSNTVTVSINVITQSSQSQGTFGLNSGDGKDTYTSDLTLTAMRFLNTAGAGTLTGLELLFDETNPHGQVRMGVYADDNGKPGSLLLDAGQVTVTNGWVSISGLNLPVAANTYYWLVFNLNRQNGVKTQTGSPQNSLAYRYIGSYGALPVSFPNPNGYYNVEYVMRATVIPVN